MPHAWRWVALWAAVVLFLGGCTAGSTLPSAPTGTAPPEPDAIGGSPTATDAPDASPEATSAVPVVDGSIGADEYAHSAEVGQGMTVWWSNDAESLYLAAEAPTSGWVSIGLDPENRMQGANYVFAYVEDGESRVWDAFGTAPTGANHPADTELGGTDDITAAAAGEADGVTRFEVQIPLDSGDSYDKPLAPGREYPMIYAYGAADAFDARHTFRGSGSIALDAAE